MSEKIKVFLSHNSDDKAAVEILANKLRCVRENDIEPWLDKWHLVPGMPWQPELGNQIDTCDVCAVFIGPHEFGPWHREEMRALIARRVEDRSQRFRVIPVLLPGAERGTRSSLPRFLVQTTWVEFRHSLDDDSSFQRLLAGIRGTPPGHSSGSFDVNTQCPYRGLQYFDVENSEQFFGRDAVTGWLVNDVRKTLRGNSGLPRFVAIIGASGSGKSSLARAGLFASLQNDAIEGSKKWRFVKPIRPGPNPLEALEDAIIKCARQPGSLLSEPVEGRIKHLRSDPAALHRAAGLLVDEPQRLVVFIDQFEEIFTECDKDELRNAFLDNLLYAARERGGRVIVVVAMRADFYPKIAAYPTLASVMASHQFLVGPMTEEQLRAAIEVPAYRAGAGFDAGLVDNLVEDVRGQAAALPLLQCANDQIVRPKG